MTRRRLVAVCVALLTAVVSPLAYLQFRTPYAVRQFELVDLGMTRAEVVALLGPGDPPLSLYRRLLFSI